MIAIGLLAAQTVFIQRWGEPYPAMVMPGFHGAGGYREGGLRIRRFEAVFIGQHEEHVFPPKVLLAEFPDSHHRAIARIALSPPGQPPQHPPQEAWQRAILHAVQPGYSVRDMPRDSPENRASLQKWLRDRATALLPGRPVSRVELRWFRESVRWEEGRLASEREEIGRLVVPLDAEPRP